MSTKIIALDENKQQRQTDVFTGRVSLEKMRAIWNDDTVSYNDEELIRLREWIHTLTEVIINVSTTHSSKTHIIPLTPSIDETAQSHSLRPCEYGRAS